MENEGLFQEYLEMGKKRVLYLCAADHFYKSLHDNICLILMENDQKHVFFLLYEAKFLYLFGGNFVLEDKQFSSLLTLH